PEVPEGREKAHERSTKGDFTEVDTNLRRLLVFFRMRILWICSLPLSVQQSVFGGEDHGARAAMSWVLPPCPPRGGIELPFACLGGGGSRRKRVEFQGV